MRHFFVDEAGDLTLFDRRGRSMLGHDGVSQCFMVGVAEIRDPAVVGRQLEALRRDLMSDPYFAGACSLHLERRKTALEAQARAMFQKTGRKLRPDDVYDALVTQLFIGRFQDDAKNHIAFATRKKAHRDAALTRAIERACVAQACTAQCEVASDRPSGAAGLQSDRLLLEGRAAAIRGVPKAGSSQELRNKDRIRLRTWTMTAMELAVFDMTVRI